MPSLTDVTRASCSRPSQTSVWLFMIRHSWVRPLGKLRVKSLSFRPSLTSRMLLLTVKPFTEFADGNKLGCCRGVQNKILSRSFMRLSGRYKRTAHGTFTVTGPVSDAGWERRQ